MSDKIEKFIAGMSLAFPKRFADETEQIEWFQMWKQALERFDPWVVEAATVRIRESRTERSFPLIAEVRKVCADVLNDDRRSKPTLPTEPEKREPYALADSLVNSEIGRQAAREGWILSLHDFCRTNYRLPSGIEIDRCRRSAQDMDRAYVEAETGRAGELSRSLAGLGRTMLARRDALAARVLGDRS